MTTHDKRQLTWPEPLLTTLTWYILHVLQPETLGQEESLRKQNTPTHPIFPWR